MNGFSLGLLLVCPLAFAPGCVEKSCDVGFAYCDGIVAHTCKPDGSSMASERCAEDQHCVVAEGEALCALSPEPDPRCEGIEQFCRSSAVLISCRNGYAQSLEDCTELGVAAENWACVTDADQPEGPPRDDCQPTEVAE